MFKMELLKLIRSRQLELLLLLAKLLLLQQPPQQLRPEALYNI